MPIDIKPLRSPLRGARTYLNKKGPGFQEILRAAPKGQGKRVFEPATAVKSLRAMALSRDAAAGDSRAYAVNAENLDRLLAQARRDGQAEAWNDRRSALQRQGFTYRAAKDDAPVSFGMSAHAVRMQQPAFPSLPSAGLNLSEGFRR
ncbi:hypothetical protein J2X06_002465 [Lysobacter niastensis]|uniref:Uncharacterized protein n=1 Tax=Lysobacter niastensis TaxID=380629 RepID=A0ABU1WCQ9_9GAMM|nr:hypothetical protein [Lysobacter niastensis]MDR7135256.1 hypothetical protein [Lysobacter niastensis]